jgi:hypothetical protein
MFTHRVSGRTSQILKVPIGADHTSVFLRLM